MINCCVFTDDAGTYVCEPQSAARSIKKLAFSSNHINSNSAVSMSVAWQQLSPNNVISYLIHVDITLPMKHKIVSADDSDYPKPAEREVNSDNNWEAFTQWKRWGECNVCGEAGERRREGRCMVRLIDADVAAEPDFLDSILRFYPEGAPCHSTLFVNFEAIIKRHNEIEVGSCSRKKVKCKKKGAADRAALGVGNFNEMIQINAEKPAPVTEKKPLEARDEDADAGPAAGAAVPRRRADDACRLGERHGAAVGTAPLVSD